MLFLIFHQQCENNKTFSDTSCSCECPNSSEEKSACMKDSHSMKKWSDENCKCECNDEIKKKM